MHLLQKNVSLTQSCHNMKKAFAILAIVMLSSCSYLAPDTSKALTEEDQLTEMKRHNAEVEKLMKEQNEIIKNKNCNCK